MGEVHQLFSNPERVGKVTKTPPNFLAMILVDNTLAPSLRHLQKIVNNNGKEFDKDFKFFLASRDKESLEVRKQLLRYAYQVLIYLGKMQIADNPDLATEEFIQKFSAIGILDFRR